MISCKRTLYITRIVCEDRCPRQERSPNKEKLSVLHFHPRLRTVSYPTGVVKPVYGIPTFPLTAKAV